MDKLTYVVTGVVLFLAGAIAMLVYLKWDTIRNVAKAYKTGLITEENVNVGTQAAVAFKGLLDGFSGKKSW